MSETENDFVHRIVAFTGGPRSHSVMACGFTKEGQGGFSPKREKVTCPTCVTTFPALPLSDDGKLHDPATCLHETAYRRGNDPWRCRECNTPL